MKYSYLLFFLIFFTYNVFSQTHVIYTMGNSLTAANGYQSRLLTKLDSTWSIVNVGISGQITAQMLDRFQKDVLDPGNAEYVIIMGGTNDVYQYYSGVTIESNLQAMYTSAHNAGIKVAAITILPASCNPIRQAVTDSVNNWIMKTAVNIDYRINAYPIIEDPTRPGSIKKVYDSGDSVHLNSVGYNVLGDLIYNSIFNPSLVEVNTALPNGFVLGQNYPNPFNSSTIIKYNLLSSAWVELNILNILGEKILTLVREYQTIGEYRCYLDASKLPSSGIYLCQLKYGHNHLINKMIFLK